MRRERRPLALEELLSTHASVTEKKGGQAKSSTKEDSSSVVWRIMSPFRFLYSPILFLYFSQKLSHSLYVYYFTSLAFPTLTTLVHLIPFIEWVAHKEKGSKLKFCFLFFVFYQGWSVFLMKAGFLIITWTHRYAHMYALKGLKWEF